MPQRVYELLPPDYQAKVRAFENGKPPISDAYLMLSSGDAPKDAWINPNGAHLGRGPNGWTDPEIFRSVIMPWELRTLAADRQPPK